MKLTITSSSLKCLVANALLFAPSKGNLAVVHFAVETPNFGVVATDGYVLSFERPAAEFAVEDSDYFSLSVADIKAMLKMLPAGKDDPVQLVTDRSSALRRAEFLTSVSSAAYSIVQQAYVPWANWLSNARANAAPQTSASIAPQFLAKVGRADPYGGQGKPDEWGGVASVELTFAREPAATMWTYGEHLSGLVKPLTNVTLSGEELAAATSRRKKATKPKCPVCKTAELTAGRERCQSCVAVEIINGGK